MPSKLRSAVRAAALLGAALASSCAAPPPASFEPPPIPLAETWFVGTPLSGPRTDAPVSVVPETSGGLALTVVGLESFHASALDPLASLTRTRVAMGAGRPIQTLAELAKYVRARKVPDGADFLASVEDHLLSRAARVAAARAALPPGTTWRARCRLGDDPGSRDRFEIQAWRLPGDGPDAAPVHLAVVREGPFVPPAPDDAAPAPGAGEKTAEGRAAGQGEDTVAAEAGSAVRLGPVILRETSILDVALEREGETLVAVVPVPGGGSVAAIAFALELTEAPGGTPRDPAALAAAAARAAAGLAEPSDAKRAARELVPDRIAVLRRAADALGEPESRRTLIIFTARETGASVAGDVALSATDEVLASVAARISARLNSLLADADAEALGWAVEAGTLDAVGGLAGEESRESEIAGVLALHLGQVGRQGAAIERAVRGARSLRELQARVVEENRLFLEDTVPQARARALEWLEARGLAPAGYDPLAGPRERRVALEKAAAAAAETEPAPEGGGEEP